MQWVPVRVLLLEFQSFRSWPSVVNTLTKPSTYSSLKSFKKNESTWSWPPLLQRRPHVFRQWWWRAPSATVVGIIPKPTLSVSFGECINTMDLWWQKVPRKKQISGVVLHWLIVVGENTLTPWISEPLSGIVVKLGDLYLTWVRPLGMIRMTPDG